MQLSSTKRRRESPVRLLINCKPNWQRRLSKSVFTPLPLSEGFDGLRTQSMPQRLLLVDELTRTEGISLPLRRCPFWVKDWRVRFFNLCALLLRLVLAD